MTRPFHSLVFYLSLVCLSGCVEVYQPPDVPADIDLLVVDGFINTTGESATVRLTYAIPLDTVSQPVPEENASVVIEKNDGSEYTLNGKGNGVYEISNTTFEFSAQYRLHIRTHKSKEYFSDYIGLKRTPPIDSVTWRPDIDGINLLVNTHDAEGDAQYYIWNYEETWEHVASFFSTYKMVDGEAFERKFDDRIYRCWDSHKSTDIIIGNSTLLSQDVIRDFPLTYVKAQSLRLSVRYSIKVQQRTLTKEAYEFWAQLKRTSESLGGLFDPQPYQVLGNIHSANSTEPVLGYFSGGEVSEQRLFIRFAELPNYLLAMHQRALCNENNVQKLFLDALPQTSNATLLIDPIYVQGVGIVGYTFAESICIDCRLSGGTLVQPDFW
ncbi:MAG TPA: DUF4249 domain-containing protein [Chryseolinea sp.]|nr:DUF4249 domain-containing protein [Chryseolinea sp.]